PMTVLIVIVIAVIIINIVVIPAFASFFKQFGATLPLPTRILMATSNFMLHYWFILLAIVIASISSWIMYLNTSEGRFFWDKWKLKLPIVGSIFFRSLLARFSRSFALSIQTGVPLMESIGLIAKATDNSYVSEKIINMRQNIERGESLTQAAVNSKMFNPLVLQMLTIGEETGEIDRLLDDVAKFYEDEVDYEVKRIGAAIEPILISVIAILVLILALGVFLPMWDISKAAMSKPG
ncbi:MAG: biosis protein MshG, partial [Francisellaceae bacterium]|nr:biosis protein MshG [Francisellaceae bacterium]